MLLNVCGAVGMIVCITWEIVEWGYSSLCQATTLSR